MYIYIYVYQGHYQNFMKLKIAVFGVCFFCQSSDEKGWWMSYDELHPPEKLTNSTWKWMVWRRIFSFPVGLFSGAFAVSFREGMSYGYHHLSSATNKNHQLRCGFGSKNRNLKVCKYSKLLRPYLFAGCILKFPIKTPYQTLLEYESFHQRPSSMGRFKGSKRRNLWPRGSHGPQLGMAHMASVERCHQDTLGSCGINPCTTTTTTTRLLGLKIRGIWRSADPGECDRARSHHGWDSGFAADLSAICVFAPDAPATAFLCLLERTFGIYTLLVLRGPQLNRL